MKFYGIIGFSYEKQTAPGVWDTISEEREAYGDVLSNIRRWDGSNEVNDSINVTNRLSVVASRFFYENLGAMRYAVWNGTKWKVKSAEIARPRIILTLGDVYHEEQGDD